MPVKVAVFDIGATLVTGPPIAPNKVIASLLNSVTAAEVASVIMTKPLESAEAVCAAIEAEFGSLNEEASIGITELWNSQNSAPVAIKGALEAVSALKSRGFEIGLLSDIWSPYYAGVEKAIPEIIAAADSIVLSYKTGIRKPAKDNFLRSLSELGVQPNEAVMIGDTYTHDILPALQLGMNAVWVLARPERECSEIIRVLNRNSPAPTAAVANISQITELPILSQIAALGGKG